MPILDVEIVAAPPPDRRRPMAMAIAEAAGDLFRAPPGETWVRLRDLPASDYAESGGGPPNGVRPVFVTVLKASLGPEDELATQAKQLTEAVARACERPEENVHVLFLPGGRGRIAFGGELVPAVG